MKNFLAAYAGIEELENAGVVEADVTAMVEEAVKVEVAEAVIEVQEIAEEVQDIAERVEEIEEVQEELEETVEGMESLLASGSYNAGAFAHMYKRASALSVKLGGKAGPRNGVESFGDSSTATINARDGMEGFMDTVKNAGKTAIEFIKALFNRLIAFVVGLFDTAKGLDKRISHLTERLGKAEIKADDKVKLGSWNTMLNIVANKTPSKLVLGGGDSVHNTVLGDKFANAVDSNAQKGDMEPVIKEFKNQYKALTGKLEVGKEITGSDSETTGRLQQLGAWRVLVNFYKGDIVKVADCTKALKELTYSFTKDSEAAKKLTGDTAPALAKSELTALLAAAKAEVTSVQKSRLRDKFTTARRDKIVGLLNVATKDLDSEDSKGKADSKAAVAFIKQYCATSGAFLTTYTRAQLKVAEAKINCVSAHV